MEKKKTGNRFSALRAVSLLLLLALAAVIITAGCVTPPTPESTVPNIEGEWTSMGFYSYSGIDGFSKITSEDIPLSDFVINQKGRLLDIKIGDGSIIHNYAAICDKDAKTYFSDSTLPLANRYIQGNIVSDNVIIESVVSYFPETKDYRASFVPLVKKGTTFNPPSEIPEYNLAGSWTGDRSTVFVDGTYAENDYKMLSLKITEIDEKKGPMFTGSFEFADSSMSVKFVGVVSSIVAEDVYTALVITENGNPWKAFINPKIVFISRVDSSVYNSYAMSESNLTPIQMPEFTKYNGVWKFETTRILGDLGYMDNNSMPFSMDIKVGVENTVTIAVSTGSDLFGGDRMYRGMIYGASQLSAGGISADKENSFTIEGFFGDDGKLYAYGISKSADGAAVCATERIYTKQANIASGVA